MKFVPLHVHSHYSLLDGLAKIDDIVNKAKEDGMEAVALTDHGVMYGTIEFFQKCKAAGIKPIIGLEAYIVKNRKTKNIAEEERFHIVLLAENFAGYKNLIKLTSIAHLEGFYYKPRIDWEVLEKHSEGIIGLTACLQGEIPRSILKGYSDDQLKQIVEKYQAIFGKDSYFLEVQHNPNIPEQKTVNNKIFEIGKKWDVPIVASNDSHYLNTEDAEAHDILLCLQTKRTISEKNRMSMLGEDFSFMTQQQMIDNFRSYPEVIENTAKIAERCNVEIPLGEIQLPHYDLPEGLTADDQLRKLCLENVPRRFDFDPSKTEFNEKEKQVMDRLNYELEIIGKTGYASYFLIVQDFIIWAKNQGIVVGPGRGSAAGSLASYLLRITDLDPIAYELLFERFLNPERVSMPDVDADFADERRDEVIRYVEEKYGKDHVAQIITFGTMASRAAVRDVGRVLELPYTFCDKISKLIPMSMGLDDAINKVEEVKELYENNDDAKRLLDFAQKMEGVARHASTHACGVVITKDSVDEYCPRQYARDQEEAVVTQYSLHPVEDIGLLKMDFLGLKNLTIIERTREIVEKMGGGLVDIEHVDLHDEKSYKLFQDGRTTGVFQFESSGMKRYLRQLRPNNIEDLIAMVALYRPGPMDLIPDYINRKLGYEKVTYVHPKLESSLKKTYGIAIYQEQIMQIARDLAGFSLGEADVLRKAMGKKIVKLLAEQKEKFVNGCVANDIPKEVGQRVFSFIEPFAGYGFNRSHAACYAYIAYQTAYLKANFPAQFMASLLTSDQHNMDRVAIEIDECKHMGIEILPPNINESYSTFTVVAESLKEGKPRIRFGLNAIRNVGEGVVKAIVHERKENGAFKSLEDLLSRLAGRDMNKKSLDGLIKCGALDLFAERNVLLENMDKLLLYAKESYDARNAKQVNIFSLSGEGEEYGAKLIFRQVESASRSEVLAMEKEFLGLYVSAHPFRDYEKKLEGLITPISNLQKGQGEKQVVRVGGVISTVKKIMTKKGDPMLFVGLEDGIVSTEILVFPRLFKKIGEQIIDGQVVIVEGTVSDKDDEVKILANKIWFLTEDTLAAKILELNTTGSKNGFVVQKPSPQIIVRYPVGASKEMANRVKMLFMHLTGDNQVLLEVQDKLVKTDFKIRIDNEARLKIEELLGQNVIKKVGVDN
jgi:DNA polymerase III subunit alpha